MQKKIKQRFEEISSLGIANDLSSPHIELDSNRQIVIEGCKGIVEYDETITKLNCGNIILKICGSCLCLNNLSNGLVIVTGDIFSVEFCTL